MHAHYDAVISMGWTCEVAYQTHINGLRKYALPFDRTITPIEALIKILKLRFYNFISYNNLAFIKQDPLCDYNYIVDTLYGIRFVHDFELKDSFLKDYIDVKNMYDRRIKRFFDVIARSKNILFIRQKITKEEAIVLKERILELCPKKNFHILAVDSTAEIKEPWNIPHVINVYLKPANPYVWSGDDAAWKEIFISLNLSLSNDSGSTKED
jgi:hypothetical protein